MTEPHLESDLQRRFIKAAAQLGMQAFPVKFRGTRGAPDTQVCNALGYHCFVELKTLDGRLKPYQGPVHRRITPWIDVYVTYGLDAAIMLLNDITGRTP